MKRRPGVERRRRRLATGNRSLSEIIGNMYEYYTSNYINNNNLLTGDVNNLSALRNLALSGEQRLPYILSGKEGQGNVTAQGQGAANELIKSIKTAAEKTGARLVKLLKSKEMKDLYIEGGSSAAGDLIATYIKDGIEEIMGSVELKYSRGFKSPIRYSSLTLGSLFPNASPIFQEFAKIYDFSTKPSKWIDGNNKWADYVRLQGFWEWVYNGNAEKSVKDSAKDLFIYLLYKGKPPAPKKLLTARQQGESAVVIEIDLQNLIDTALQNEEIVNPWQATFLQHFQTKEGYDLGTFSTEDKKDNGQDTGEIYRSLRNYMKNKEIKPDIRTAFRLNPGFYEYAKAKQMALQL